MRYAWRAVLVLGVFLGVGFTVMHLVMHLVIAHSVDVGTPATEIRLAGAMAGLFAGGAAACLAGIATMWGRPRV